MWGRGICYLGLPHQIANSLMFLFSHSSRSWRFSIKVLGHGYHSAVEHWITTCENMGLVPNNTKIQEVSWGVPYELSGIPILQYSSFLWLLETLAWVTNTLV